MMPLIWIILLFSYRIPFLDNGVCQWSWLARFSFRIRKDANMRNVSVASIGFFCFKAPAIDLLVNRVRSYTLVTAAGVIVASCPHEVVKCRSLGVRVGWFIPLAFTIGLEECDLWYISIQEECTVLCTVICCERRFLSLFSLHIYWYKTAKLSKNIYMLLGEIIVFLAVLIPVNPWLLQEKEELVAELSTNNQKTFFRAWLPWLRNRELNRYLDMSQAPG